MRDGYQRRTKKIFIAKKHHNATVMGVVSIPVHPLMHVALKTMHHAQVIQTVKQTVQLFREKYTETRWPRNNGHMYYRLINVYRTHHQPSTASDKDYLKVED
jgi:hypothetical protein